ncbi:MAG TPA: NAD(P)/FAD-dependent oxidoreductase [Polyangiaceae bacterium]|jgi:flavin-dependent dehydrogenase|nr:NAD(P)/FAD-dependent oxidoreductase [Polyangiaceae bacterium]
MSSERYDLIVIGGGPAGAAVSTLLARGGRRVLVLEKEQFPRFHIGESLLPCAMPLFEQLGVLPELEQRFLPKHAAEFVTADGSITRRYTFAHGRVQGPRSAFEVDRAEFDALLLENARRNGAEVRQGVKVHDFSLSDAGASVSAKAEDGSVQTFETELLVDASGQQSLLAGRLGLRKMDPQLRNFSVFSHFEGASRGVGDCEGDISIVLVPGGWWWVIPLRGDRTSVGLVAPSRTLHGRKPDEAYLLESIENTPYLRERLRGARRVTEVRAVSDWSYSSERLAGDRWLLVGDAAAFIDPVFSTGVYLGLASAFRAAGPLEHALRTRTFRRSEFVAYERTTLRAVAGYRDFVRGFYHPAFVEVLLHPSDWMGLRGAITSLLAGFGMERFEVSWRVALFQLLARVNRHVELVPRLPERRAALLPG